MQSTTLSIVIFSIDVERPKSLAIVHLSISSYAGNLISIFTLTSSDVDLLIFINTSARVCGLISNKSYSIHTMSPYVNNVIPAAASHTPHSVFADVAGC